ncbi:Hypothetical protein DPCES_1643 [Desulfitobacterium hafniense]|uniref:Uncharacterized protein n=1 Tax=Desulfitobacterium hafniense TaxID=49338 RepID=A0A098AZJ1_DESHA|nr:hypothetical protein [Desulfitobacterium hafniense]CDX01530.1 Hypothetical protein DPCES_1643 [Desulfitobacterium hafniense]
MEDTEIKRIVSIIQSMNEEFSYMDAVGAIFYGNYSRCNIVWVCANLWSIIPEPYLYEAYKEALSEAMPVDYNQFFKDDLLNKLHRLNHHDTINNPALIDKLDADGYLTIYHGHTKPTMRGSHSWSLSPETAHFFGNRNALFYSADKYYVVTGKCRPEDIIAYITDRNEEEIVILNKDVKDKHKEFYPKVID